MSDISRGIFCRQLPAKTDAVVRCLGLPHDIGGVAVDLLPEHLEGRPGLANSSNGEFSVALFEGPTGRTSTRTPQHQACESLRAYL
jgi:hypothetical protein